MKHRAISNIFLNSLLIGEFKHITETVKVDPSLDMEMRGDSVMVYYRGGRILTINDLSIVPNRSKLEGMDENYSNETKFKQEIPVPDIDGIDEYFARAKRVVDNYEFYVEHKLGEKEIQQRVVCENNYSVNADETDFFIADVEWADNDALGGRADIIAFHWGHMSHKKRKLTMFIIEVKQGKDTVKTNKDKDGKLSAGLYKHNLDFENFISNEEYVEAVKADMIKVLRQKYELGLVNGLDELFDDKNTGAKRGDDEIDITPKVQFVYLLANYLKYSKELRNELEKVKNAKFLEASMVGYGLYKDFIVDKRTLFEHHPDLA